MSKQPMSMEAMLDEERREVLALLEERQPQTRRPASIAVGRSSSPFSPRSPVRSLLEMPIVSRSPARSSSIASGRSGLPPAPIRSMLDDIDTPPPTVPTPFRSMLDVDSPPPSASQASFGSTESNYRAHAANHGAHHRTASDASNRPPEFSPRLSVARNDPLADYQFSDILTNKQGPVLKKRVTQKKKFGGSMAEVMRGADVSSMGLPPPSGRHYSTAGLVGHTNKSKSPHNRLGVRSASPHLSLGGRTASPNARVLLDEGGQLDLVNAYRLLTDANLARSGGSLSELTRRKKSDDASNGRLQKDYLSPDGDLLHEDSSEDEAHSSSDDEGERGRKAARTFPEETGSVLSVGSDGGREGRKSLSLLAAAEEERLHVALTQPYRSLLDDPEITVTNTSGDKGKAKATVHPATSFEYPSRSGSHTPLDSEEEAEVSDIRRAQKLSFSLTPIMSHSECHRAIRIIYRGEYSNILQDAEDNHRRLRKYLVATDMSDESTHALEWAIGTVLRDGDTLVAIYCVDEETGIVSGDNQLVPDDPKAMREQAVALNAVASGKAPPAATSSLFTVQHQPGPLARAMNLGHASSSPAPPSSDRGKAEEERFRAVADITDRVTRLLRKTRLQVRVIVEVLHCKNPKHLITEVIDLVNPTLVILGSRGRSALKGVILGSFSNYLVTKSSVPVMVARKRLKKQSKYKRAPVHQVNNLSNPTAKSLANAKID